MSPNIDDIPEIALGWHNDGRRAALATVVKTWGSAPRPVGSQFAISGNSEIAGSVSGGCVEGAVVAEALDALDAGTSRILTYGVTNDEAFEVGLACGGEIQILVEPVGDQIPVRLLEQLCAERANRHAVAYHVNIEDWSRAIIDRADAPENLAQRFTSDRSGFDGSSFFAIHNPPLRMAIIGAVHIAQSLAQMARVAGYDLFIIDPRDAFASQARFPGETLSHDWPDDALKAFGIDARTAIVTLSHDPKIDDPALVTALESDAFYVGALGSSRTHAKRVDRLLERGFSKEQIARIQGPVGLDIAAKLPPEIAVSILAEITQTLRQL